MATKERLQQLKKDINDPIYLKHATNELAKEITHLFHLPINNNGNGAKKVCKRCNIEKNITRFELMHFKVSEGHRTSKRNKYCKDCIRKRKGKNE